jgi:hypothetical protein
MRTAALTCSLQLNREGHCETDGQQPHNGWFVDKSIMQATSEALHSGNRQGPDVEIPFTTSGSGRSLLKYVRCEAGSANMEQMAGRQPLVNNLQGGETQGSMEGWTATR